MSESKHSLISKYTIHLDKHLIIRFLSMPLNLLFTNVFIYAQQIHSCFLQHTYTIEYRFFGVLRVKGLKFWSSEKFEALKFLSVKSPKIFGSINILKVYNWSDCKGTGTHNHLVRKRTRKHQPNKSNGDCEFESCCSHLNFRCRACFEEGVFWHSGNYRV